MDEARRRQLQELVEKRFDGISTAKARAAYAEGFPFGIGDVGRSSEQQEFVENYAAAILKSLLAATEE